MMEYHVELLYVTNLKANMHTIISLQYLRSMFTSVRKYGTHQRGHL